jgi:hypothetical protein
VRSRCVCAVLIKADLVKAKYLPHEARYFRLAKVAVSIHHQDQLVARFSPFLSFLSQILDECCSGASIIIVVVEEALLLPIDRP